MKRTGCSIASRLSGSSQSDRFCMHLVKLSYALGSDSGNKSMSGRWSRGHKTRHDMFRLTQAREQLCGGEIRAGPCAS